MLLHRFFTAAKVTDGLDNMAALEEDLTALQYHLYSELWPKDEDGDGKPDMAPAAAPPAPVAGGTAS